jgi:hypothetical protein
VVGASGKHENRRFRILLADHPRRVETVRGNGKAKVEYARIGLVVHAVAPDATIRELLVDPADVSTPAKLAATFATYVRIAVGQHADVISQSGIGQDFNVGEGSFTSAAVVTMNSALEYAAA